MKIHIKYEFKEGPYGGGNQFLKALRAQFRQIGVYAENPDNADVILFNSHHCVSELIKLRKKYADKIFIHRVDGPILKIRKRDLGIDKLIYKLNETIADGTVFQTNWSREANYKQGMKKNNFETVILNAPNAEIFNQEGKIPFEKNRKTRLIATSWAANMSKGFDVYKYLDKNLDFDKFEMTFVGNSPVEFKNIKWIRPVSSIELAEILKQHDIYITGSKNDPCSNSLIEALSCGLPAIALNDGGHPEIVMERGELFEKNDDVIQKILKIIENFNDYQSRIAELKIEGKANQYFNYAERINNAYREQKYQVKKLNLHSRLSVIHNILSVQGHRILNKIHYLLEIK